MSSISLEDYYCPVLDDDAAFVVKDADGVRAFEETFTIRYVHESMPRFGHDKDLTVVVNGTSDQAWDYLWGILAAPVLIFAIFVVWMLLIIVMRCCGVGRVGFWAGNMQKPAKPIEQGPMVVDVDAADETTTSNNNYKEELAEYERTVQKRETRLKRIRIAVLFSGVCIITFAVVMIVMGVTALVDSLRDGKRGVRLMAGLGQGIIDLINRYLAVENEAVSTAANLTFTMNGFCPKVEAKLCTNASRINTCNLNGIPGADEIRNYLQQQGQTDFANELTLIRSDLQEVVDLLNQAAQELSSFNWAFWVAAGFAIALAVLTLFIISTLVRAWCGYKRIPIFDCFRRFVLVPLFGFFVVLSWVFSMVFIIGSVVSADACFQSPDHRVIAVLDSFEFDSVVIRLLKYYVTGCLAHDFPPEISNMQSNWAGYARSVNSLGTYFVNNMGFLEQTCGGDQLAGVYVLTKALARVSCNVFTLIHAISELFACSNWNPLYTTFAYDAVCYNGNKGFTWIAWSQFVIVLFAMIMLTLRISFASDVFDQEDDDMPPPRQEQALAKSTTSTKPDQVPAAVAESGAAAGTIVTEAGVQHEEIVHTVWA